MPTWHRGRQRSGRHRTGSSFRPGADHRWTPPQIPSEAWIDSSFENAVSARRPRWSRIDRNRRRDRDEHEGSEALTGPEYSVQSELAVEGGGGARGQPQVPDLDPGAESRRAALQPPVLGEDPVPADDRRGALSFAGVDEDVPDPRDAVAGIESEAAADGERAAARGAIRRSGQQREVDDPRSGCGRAETLDVDAVPIELPSEAPVEGQLRASAGDDHPGAGCRRQRREEDEA